MNKYNGVQVVRANSADIITGELIEETAYGKWVTQVGDGYKVSSTPSDYLSDGGPFFKTNISDTDVLNAATTAASGAIIDVVDSEEAVVYDEDLVSVVYGSGEFRAGVARFTGT